MTDESTGTKSAGGGAEGSDAIQQLKAETNRKLSSITEQMGDLKKASDLLLERLSQSQAPASSVKTEESEDLSSLMYSDPAAYARRIEERAEKRIMSNLQNQNAAVAKQNAVLSELTYDYPELGDKNSALTKRAVEIYGQLPVEDRSSPLSYRLAVKEAATELSVKPRSKRTEDDENFMGSSSGGSRRGERSKKDKVDPNTELWAEALGDQFRELGHDYNDNVVKERIAKRAQRSWSKWQQPDKVKKGGR